MVAKPGLRTPNVFGPVRHEKISGLLSAHDQLLMLEKQRIQTNGSRNVRSNALAHPLLHVVQPMRLLIFLKKIYIKQKNVKKIVLLPKKT